MSTDNNLSLLSGNLEYTTRRLYLVAISLSLFSTVMSGTEWPFAREFKYLSLVGLIFALFRFCAVFLKTKGRKHWFILLSFPCVIITIFKVALPLEVIYPYFFLISAYKVSFRKILRCFLAVNLAVWVLTTIAVLLHVLPNLNLAREAFDADNLSYSGEYVNRFRFGYNYPTNYAAHLTYISILWFVIRERRAKTIEYLMFLLGACFVYRFCYARLDSALLCMVVMMFFLYNKSLKSNIWNNPIISFLLKYSVVLSAVLIIILTYSYYLDSSSESLLLLDLLLSGRLRLGAEAFDSHGITIFGQEFIFRFHNDIHGYNYIDSSYIQLLIVYGIIFFLLTIFCHLYVCKSYLSKNAMYIPIAILLVALHSVVFQGLMSFEFNPFYLGLLAKHNIQNVKV